MSLQIQLKKSAVSQKQPFASDLAVGELALNYNADGPFLTCKDSAGNVRKLNHVWVAATSPTSPKAGDQWLDISSATAVLKVYKDSSSTWVNATTVPLATTSIYGTVQLASSADVTNGTSGKIVDAAQLQSKVTTEITSALSANPLQLNSLQVSNNTVINGDLTVNGTTTTIDTTTLVVEDKNIEMGAFDVPTDSTANGGGIILQGTTNKSITWNNSTDAWTSSERLDLPAGTAASPSLIFNGDVNSGVYSPGADQLAISTGGTGQLFIDASGNVALGAAAYSGGLTIFRDEGQTTANISTTSNTASFFVARHSSASTGAGGGLILGAQGGSFAAIKGLLDDGANNTTGSIAFSTRTSSTDGTLSERVRIISDGKVGIGTSTPASRLHVSDGELTVSTGTNLADSGGIINFGITTAPSFSPMATVQGLLANATGTELQGGLGFFTRPSGVAGQSLQRRMTITAEGSVGIGTTNPGNRLHVMESSASAAAATGASVAQFERFGNSAITVSTSDSGQATLFFGDTSSYTVGRVQYEHSADALAFWANSNERARITADGKLLVGTTESQGNGGSLQVGGNSIGGAAPTAELNAFGFDGRLRLTRASTGSPITAVANGDIIGRVAFDGYDGSAYREAARITTEVDGTPGANTMPGKLVFSTTSITPDANPAPRMTIKADGKVGIGTATPGETLEVAGNISLSPNPGSFRVLGAGFSTDTTVVLQSGGASGTGGNIELGRDGAIVYDATNHIFRNVSGTGEYARIDDVGRLLVGSPSSNQVPTGEGANRQPYLQVGSNTYESSALSSILFAPDAIGGGSLSLARSNTSTIGDQALANSGDVAGSVFFSASDGAKQVRCAQIAAQIDGTPNTDDMPGRLVLYTTAAGANTPTEQMRITSDSVRVYNQPAPIAINAATVATIDQLKTGLITCNGASSFSITLPNGADCDAGFNALYNGMAFEWSIVNTNVGFIVSVLSAALGNNRIGNQTITANTPARYITRRSGVNTWETYRVST